MTNNLYKIQIILCFCGFGIISFIPDIFNISAQTITVPYRALILVISMIILINKIEARINLFNILIFLFIVFYSLRFIHDIFFTGLVFDRSNEELLFYLFFITIIPAWSLSKINSKIVLEKIPKILENLFFTISIMSLIFGSRIDLRLDGNSVLNPITLGHFAASGLILILISYKESKSKFFKLLKALTLIVVLFLTASRGALISLIVVGVIFYFINYGISVRKLIFTIPILILLTYLSLEITQSFDSIFLSRTKIDLGENYEGGEQRVFLWVYTFNEILKSPVFGSSVTTIYGYPHNMFLEILLSTGIIGFLIIVYVVMIAIKKSFTYGKSFLWISLLFTQFIVSALFSGTIYYNYEFWYCLGLVTALNSINKNEN